MRPERESRPVGTKAAQNLGGEITSIVTPAAPAPRVPRDQVRAGLALSAILAPDRGHRDEVRDRRLERALRERDRVLAGAHHLVELHTADEIKVLAERDRARGCSEADMTVWRAWWREAAERETIGAEL